MAYDEQLRPYFELERELSEHKKIFTKVDQIEYAAYDFSSERVNQSAISLPNSVEQINLLYNPTAKSRIYSEYSNPALAATAMIESSTVTGLGIGSDITTGTGPYAALDASIPVLLGSMGIAAGTMSTMAAAAMASIFIVDPLLSEFGLGFGEIIDSYDKDNKSRGISRLLFRGESASDPYGRRGLSLRDSRKISNIVEKEASKYDIEFDEVLGELNEFIEAGTLSTTTSIEDFKKQWKDLKESVTSIMKTFSQTKEEAIQTIREIQQRGIASSVIPGLTGLASSIAENTGLNVNAIMQLGLGFAQSVQGTGVSAATGFKSGLLNYYALRNAIDSGFISREDIFQMGGEENAAMFLMRQGFQAYNNPLGDTLLRSLYTGSPDVSLDSIRDYVAGRKGVFAVSREAASNMYDPTRQLEYIADKTNIIDELQNNAPGMGLALRLAEISKYIENVGKYTDLTPKAIEGIVSATFGIKPEEYRAMVASAQAMRNEMMVTSEKTELDRRNYAISMYADENASRRGDILSTFQKRGYTDGIIGGLTNLALDTFSLGLYNEVALNAPGVSRWMSKTQGALRQNVMSAMYDISDFVEEQYFGSYKRYISKGDRSAVEAVDLDALAKNFEYLEPTIIEPESSFLFGAKYNVADEIQRLIDIDVLQPDGKNIIRGRSTSIVSPDENLFAIKRRGQSDEQSMSEEFAEYWVYDGVTKDKKDEYIFLGDYAIRRDYFSTLQSPGVGVELLNLEKMDEQEREDYIVKYYDEEAIEAFRGARRDIDLQGSFLNLFDGFYDLAPEEQLKVYMASEPVQKYKQKMISAGLKPEEVDKRIALAFREEFKSRTGEDFDVSKLTTTSFNIFDRDRLLEEIRTREAVIDETFEMVDKKVFGDSWFWAGPKEFSTYWLDDNKNIRKAVTESYATIAELEERKERLEEAVKTGKKKIVEDGIEKEVTLDASEIEDIQEELKRIPGMIGKERIALKRKLIDEKISSDDAEAYSYHQLTKEERAAFLDAKKKIGESTLLTVISAEAETIQSQLKEMGIEGASDFTTLDIGQRIEFLASQEKVLKEKLEKSGIDIGDKSAVTEVIKMAIKKGGQTSFISSGVSSKTVSTQDTINGKIIDALNIILRRLENMPGVKSKTSYSMVK